MRQYDVQLAIDPATRTIRGQVVLSLTANSDGMNAFDLDCGALIIDGVDTDDAHTPLAFEKRADTLHIRLPRAWQLGESRRVRVRYHGQPRAGLEFVGSGWYTAFTTQGWLPCDADPSDKARFTLQLDAPAGLRVYATGTRGATTPLPDGRQRSFWTLAKPYSAYLFGMVAGDFVEQCREVHGVDVCAAAAQAHAAELPRILDIAAAGFDFYVAHASVPYPFGARYDQVFVPGDVAQELAGLAVLGDDYFAALAADAHEDWMVLHELAHQWWGNSVSARSWTDFWLNEGITTFMVAAAKEQRWGRADYDNELALMRRRYRRALGKTPRPIVFAGWQQPSEMGGAITYSGGALMLDRLRRQLGDTAFWQGLRGYSRANASDTVTTAHLQAAMEDACHHSLAPFFAQWLLQLPPALAATVERAAGILVVDVTQSSGQPLTQSLRAAVATASGRQTQPLALREGHGQARFTVGEAELLSLRVDDGAQLPVVICYPRSVTMLLYQLAHEPDVAGRFEAATELEARCLSPTTPVATTATTTTTTPATTTAATREPECAQLPAVLATRAATEPSPRLRELEQRLVAPPP